MLDITSPANPKIKWLVSLHKSSVRREEGVFVVEGLKEINAALKHSFSLKTLFSTPEIYDGPLPPTPTVFRIAKNCFAKAAYRDASDGLIGVFAIPNQQLETFQPPEQAFIIIVEAVEKPGNLGAIIRTADATRADAVIVCDERTDLWNPNTIRASVGTIFSTPVFSAPNQVVLQFLEQHTITPYAAALTDGAQAYTKQDYTKATALLLGTEAEGLSQFWLDRAKPIIIPMLGQNDSLNVSVATGVLAYEVVRQRYDR